MIALAIDLDKVESLRHDIGARDGERHLGPLFPLSDRSGHNHRVARGRLAAGLCNGETTAASVQSPGPQTNVVGDSISLPIIASDATGTALSYSASGLPDGLTIDRSTGVISGSPTTAGTYSVKINVVDANGGRAPTVFSWQVNDATQTAVQCGPASAAGTAQTCTATVNDVTERQDTPLGP